MPDVKEITTAVAEQAASVDAAVKAAGAVGDTGKALLKSKTFWANIILGAAHYLGYLPANAAPYAIAGVNIAVRLLTSDPITSLAGK